MKKKDSKEAVRAILIMITKKNRPKKIWVDKGTVVAGEFEKLCKAEGTQIYSIMSETKAAIRSLKIYFTVTWTTMGTSIFTIESILYNTKFYKKLLDRLDTLDFK